MKKDIKDYLHLYLGCEVMYYPTTKSTGKKGLLIQFHIALDVAYMRRESGYVLKEVSRDLGHPSCIVHIQREDGSVSDSSHGDSQWYPAERIKPILRPLSDMTEEEYREYRQAHPKTSRWGVVGKLDSGASDFDTWAAFEVQYLLSKGFDLFDLIPAGLAIDKTTLKQEA